MPRMRRIATSAGHGQAHTQTLPPVGTGTPQAPRLTWLWYVQFGVGRCCAATMRRASSSVALGLPTGNWLPKRPCASSRPNDGALARLRPPGGTEGPRPCAPPLPPGRAQGEVCWVEAAVAAAARMGAPAVEVAEAPQPGSMAPAVAVPLCSCTSGTSVGAPWQRPQPASFDARRMPGSRPCPTCTTTCALGPAMLGRIARKLPMGPAWDNRSTSGCFWASWATGHWFELDLPVCLLQTTSRTGNKNLSPSVSAS